MIKLDCASGLAKMAYALIALVVLISLYVSPAFADGMPHAWGLGLQTPGSSIGTRIFDFHNILLAIITAVVVLVLVLLLYVIMRFNKRVNPEPSSTTHNLKLEIVWTVIPCLIVLGIAWISFPLLYYMDRMPNPDLTLKVTGHQWYWSYEYPDRNVSFDSLAIWTGPEVTEESAAPALKEASSHWLIQEDKPQRLLEVDNRVVLPVGKVIRVQITGADVLHSWFIPSLGVNRMAVTGRLNEVWFRIDKPGLYFGQCSMICGNGHGYMPIVIEGVPPEQFEAWVAAKKTAESRGMSPIASK